MPKLWGREVKITRVGENSVTVVHVRQRGARRLRDADYTTTDKRNRNIRRDHVTIPTKVAKKQGLLRGLFSRGRDAKKDDNDQSSSGPSLQIRW